MLFGKKFRKISIFLHFFARLLKYKRSSRHCTSYPETSVSFRVIKMSSRAVSSDHRRGQNVQNAQIIINPLKICPGPEKPTFSNDIASVHILQTSCKQPWTET